MPCYSPLKGYKNVETGGFQFKRTGKAIEKMEVSCGGCIGCRLDRSRMWAMRCVHEASLHEFDQGNSFITLTYDDDHIPSDWSLNHDHWKLFMKRLRKHFPQKIKFYMCGEYGNKCQHIPSYSQLTVKHCDQCNVGRPHYHAILFNCSFDDLLATGQDKGVTYYTSPLLEKLWSLGFVQVGEVNFQSCAYVARYVTKKVTGNLAADWYTWIDDYGELHRIKPEYNSMSRGCRKGETGIAGEWYEKYKTDLWPRDEVPVPGSGVFKKVPRYYESLLEAEDPETHEYVKKERLKYRKMNGHEYTPERLMAKYKVKKAQVNMLKRTLE
jgi:hypothetical protein